MKLLLLLLDFGKLESILTITDVPTVCARIILEIWYHLPLTFIPLGYEVGNVAVANICPTYLY